MSLSLRRAALAVALLVGFPLLVIAPVLSSALPAPLFAWAPRADAPIDRVEGVGALVGDRLYVLSGFLDGQLHIARQVDVYDLTGDRWEVAVSEMPGLGVTHITPAVDGTTIWIAGGFVGDHPGPVTDAVWRYDTATNQWIPGPSLPEPRAAGSLVRLGRRLHFFGGFAFRDTPVQLDNTRADHWTLDLDDPQASWQPAAALPEPLGHHSGVALDGLIYAIGGQIRHDRSPVDLAGVYVYDPARDAWAARASLPAPRSHAEPGSFVLRGRIVVVGGRNNTTIIRSAELRDVVMYDPASDLWLDLPQLPYKRIAPIALFFGDQIVVTNGGLAWDLPQRLSLGGALPGTWETEHPPAPLAPGAAGGAIVGRRLFVLGAAISETLAFDLSLGAWEPVTTHPPRPLPTGGQAVESFGGRLYVFGGVGAAARAVQIYDPATGGWGAGAELPFAASEAAALRVGDLIYLFSSAGAARYHPATDSWEPLPPAPLAVRDAGFGTDGVDLYLFGGSDERGPLDVVQRYRPATGAWASSREPGAELAPLPQPRSGSGRVAWAGGEFHLIGGVGVAATPLDSVAIYAPATGSWREGGLTLAPRAAAAAALVADRLYIVGGLGADGLGMPVITVYNLAPADRISPTPTATPATSPMPTATPATSPTPTPRRDDRLYLPLVRR